MPSRSEIQAFLIANNLEAASSDQAMLCFAEKLVGLLGEVTADMEFVGRCQIEDCAERDCSYTSTHAYRQLFAARFGEGG